MPKLTSIRFSLFYQRSFYIRMRVHYDGKVLTVQTGRRLKESSVWDGENECVIVGAPGSPADAQEINHLISQWRNAVRMAFSRFAIDEVSPTPQSVCREFSKYLEPGLRPRSLRNDPTLDGVKRPGRPAGSGKAAPAPAPALAAATADMRKGAQAHLAEKAARRGRPKAAPGAKPGESFFEVFDAFVKNGVDKCAWTHACQQKIAALRADLYGFNPRLTFDSLDENGLTDFVVYLRKKKIPKCTIGRLAGGFNDDGSSKTGLADTTIKKKLGFLTWFLNFATLRGFNSNMAYKAFRPNLHIVRNPVIFLDENELRQVMNLELGEKYRHLEIVRDTFLFCCFTSLRYSDVRNLRRADVVGDDINIVTVKTQDSVSIHMNNHAKAIYDKYKGLELPGGRALPVISNVHTNIGLKKLCRLAGIDRPIRIVYYRNNKRYDSVHPKWELMSSHAGRRTFIVNSLSMGIPPDVVMKWTGHSDYQAMKPYIDIVDSTKKVMMDKWNNWL